MMVDRDLRVKSEPVKGLGFNVARLTSCTGFAYKPVLPVAVW